MTDLIAEIDALAEGWDTSKFWVDACGPHSNSRDYVIAVVKAYPQLREMARENERLRNGFDNLLDALDKAPGLPMELLSREELEKWTDAITGILIALGPYRATGKPHSIMESLLDAAMQGGDK